MKIVFVDVELGRAAIKHNGRYYVYTYEPPECEHEVKEEEEEEVSNEDTIHRD